MPAMVWRFFAERGCLKFMCCPSSTTAHLSSVCFRRKFPLRRSCFLHVFHRSFLYYFLSLLWFSRSVLLIPGDAGPQPPPVSPLFAVAAAIFLSVGPVACMCCPSSTTAHLSTVCFRRNFPLRRSCFLHVLPVLSHRSSLQENHVLPVSLGGDGRGKLRQGTQPSGQAEEANLGSGREGIARQVSLLHCV